MTTGTLAAPPAYPTRRDEAWRYAPHRTLAELSFGPSAETAAAVPAELEAQIPALDGPRLVVVNGVVDAARSSLAGPAGFRLSTLAEQVGDDSELIAAHRTLPEPADGFATFNVEYGVDGAVVEVADHVEIDAPIHVVHLDIPGAAHNSSCAGVVVHVGTAGAATLVETHLGAGAEFGGSNVRTTVTLDAGATLEHIVVQDLPSTRVHLGRIEVTQAARSTYRARSFNLGASYGRLAYEVRLLGEGAAADLSGLFFGFGDQTLDQQITVVHGAADCTSRQAFRGVLDDESTGVFNGGIEVRPGADGTDAEQSNHNLILSDRAEINTQPRLEILADEVACKHGATVGQLDDTALYYLRSRGIPVDDARRLLINGFADQVVDLVGIDVLRSWITHRLGHDLDV